MGFSTCALAVLRMRSMAVCCKSGDELLAGSMVLPCCLASSSACLEDVAAGSSCNAVKSAGDGTRVSYVCVCGLGLSVSGQPVLCRITGLGRHLHEPLYNKTW
jgi:hypothetical protein